MSFGRSWMVTPMPHFRGSRYFPLLLGPGLALLISFCGLPTSAKTTTDGADVLLAANQGEASLSIFDPHTGRELGKILEGDITGHEVAAAADGKVAYVPIYGNSSVGEAGSDGQELIAIDLVSRKIINRLDFGRPVRPHCAVFNPRDGMLYVTTELDHTVTIVDPQTLHIVGVIPTGQSESHMLALSHDGRFGYVSNVGPGTVSVLDLKARKLITIIPISEKIERISISSDDRMVFAADQMRPRLAVIDTETNSVKSWVPLSASGYGTASTHDGRWLLVALLQASQVAVVDLNTLQVVHIIDVPPKPIAIVVSPADDLAYVSCGRSGKIVAIKLSDWTVQGVFDAGKHVDGLAWATSR
jgi:DNA-binding beta-propeller fold protein YncE